MFRLKNKDVAFPALYEHVERKLASINDKGWDKVGDFVLRDGIDLIPQEGMQEDVCKCTSNLIFACGQATSGKSFSIFQKALQGVGVPNYTARLINVRKLDSAKGTSMFRDAQLVWGEFSNCQVTYGELPTFAWPQWNNSIQMIHANFNADNPSEWADFIEYIKKQQASFIGIDEVTAIRQFKMFLYIFSRNRDSSGITPQMLVTFNPEYEHWTTQMLICGGYIGEDFHIKPEMDGRERFFYVQGNEPEDMVWGDTKEEVVRASNIKLNKDDIAAGLRPEDMVKSFTCFTGTASGNRKLVAATRGQSVANLHNVGGKQRAVLAEAYFGPIENEEISVTKKMVRDLISNPINDDENMYATMDVSGGGSESDNCPIVIWKGLRIVAIEMFRGDPKQLVEWIDAKLVQYGVPVQNFAFDATGIGNYLKAYTNGYPITANKTAMQEYDENGNQVVFEQYFNLRSQLLGKMKVLFETGKISCGIPLETRFPYGKKGETRRLDDILYDEIDIFAVTTKNNRIYYRSKDEYKSRHRRSPDLMDTITLRAVWELDARPKKQPAPDVEDDAYDDIFMDYTGGRAGAVVWV